MMTKMAYFIKIKLSGGCRSFIYIFYLFVCRHSALPPRIDLCISRTSLAIAMTMGEQMRNNPRENTTEEDGNSDRQSELMNERNQEIVTLRFQFSCIHVAMTSFTRLVVLVESSLVISHYTH